MWETLKTNDLISSTKDQKKKKKKRDLRLNDKRERKKGILKIHINQM